jgi:hypothetical protein
MLFLVAVILFFITGYFFILKLIEAVQDVGSPRVAAFFFVVWASSAIMVTANILNL